MARTEKNASQTVKRRAKRRGAVLVEYAFLLVAVGIPAMGGIAAGGLAMFNEYKYARLQILMPFP